MSSNYLTDEEELSLNLLALILFERVPFSCNKCALSENAICKDYNCTGAEDPEPIDPDSEESVLYIPEIQTEFTSCPAHFINPEHYTFFDKYNYIQEFPHTMPSWEDCDPRFWESYKLFKGLYNKYANEPKKTTEVYDETGEDIKGNDNSGMLKHFKK